MTAPCGLEFVRGLLSFRGFPEWDLHYVLHLLGYDHETSPLEERKMREKEEEVLGELGISREATFTNQPEDTDA